MKRPAKVSTLGKPGLLLQAIALLALAGIAFAGGGCVERSVMAGGGGHAEASIYELDGTIGQAIVGLGPAGSSKLCSGFWCRQAVVVYDGYHIYLPLELKND